MTTLDSINFGELVVDIKSGFACGDESRDGVLQIRMNNITRDGKLDFSKKRLIPPNNKNIPQTLLIDDDVIFNSTNSPELVGKTAIFHGNNNLTVFSNHFLRIRGDNSKISQRYIYRWLQFQYARGVFRSLCRQWVNQATVSKDSLLSLSIPLPSLAQQDRMTEALDSIDALRARRREAIVLFDELAQSVFIDMFGDPVHNARGFPQKTIGEIGKVATGNTPSRENNRHYGNHIEWIKSDNIEPNFMYLTPAKEGLSQSGVELARTVPKGALLVTCIAGSPASIGNVAVADREVSFNQQINAIIPQDMHPSFLYIQLKIGKKLIQEQSSGGMKGMVSKSRFESVSLIEPPLADQYKFAKRLAAIEKLKATHRSHLAHLDELFASVQQRAFRGDLWADSAA